MSLIRNQTPFQRSRDSSIQDGNLRFENVRYQQLNVYIFQQSDTVFAKTEVVAHIHIHVHPSKRLCYYLSNCARNEVAMGESFFLTLEGIGWCVGVHTIYSIAKNYK